MPDCGGMMIRCILFPKVSLARAGVLWDWNMSDSVFLQCRLYFIYRGLLEWCITLCCADLKHHLILTASILAVSGETYRYLIRTRTTQSLIFLHRTDIAQCRTMLSIWSFNWRLKGAQNYFQTIFNVRNGRHWSQVRTRLMHSVVAAVSRKTSSLGSLDAESTGETSSAHDRFA